MKIQSYNNNYIYNKPQKSFKGDIVQFPVKKQEQTIPSDNTITNPEYYQQVNGIKKPSYVISIELDSGEKTSLDIEFNTIKQYLSDKNGFPDMDLVMKFASLYKDIYQELAETNKKNIEFNKNQLENPFQIPEVMKSIPYKKRKEFFEMILEHDEEQSKEIPQMAFDKAKELFMVSKTKNGYDFSNIDGKNNFLEGISTISYNYDKDKNLMIDKFLKYATDTEGNFDIELANNVIYIIEYMSYYEKPEYIIQVLKTLYSRDKDNKESITDTIINLNKTCYSMDSKNDIFEQLMNLCFDKENHFDEERAETLLLAADTGEAFSNQLLESPNEYYKYSKRFIEISANAIMEYFKGITDENGNINPDKIDIDQYFADNFCNLKFI